MLTPLKIPPRRPVPVVADEEKTRQARKRAAQLLEAVIDERMVPQVAINRWPMVDMQQDYSLEIAYQALWHFEGDEDKQREELFYMDTQLELLNQMAKYLAQGKPLPDYMTSLYPRRRNVQFYYDVPFHEDLIIQLRRIRLEIRNIWHRAFSVLKRQEKIS